MINPRQLVATMRTANWLNAERARGYGRLLAAAVLIFGIAAQAKIFLPAFSDASARPLASDFNAFWSGARLALAGQPALAYDTAHIAAMENSAAQMHALLYPYLYPPVWMLLCLPFGALPYLVALPAFLLIGYAICVSALRAMLPARWPVLSVVAFPAAILNAAIGQNGFVTMSCFAGALLTLERQPWLAGACLGVLAFKPQLAIGVPVALLLSRRWAALAACVATATASVLASWAVLGTAAWRAFFAAIPFIGNILNDRGISSKLISVYAGIRLSGGSVRFAMTVQVILSLAALGCVAYVSIKRVGAAAQVATLVAATMLCTPYLMDYDLVCLGVPMAWLAAQGVCTGWRDWEKLTLAAAYVVPLVARLLNVTAGLPIAPLMLTALLAVIVRRAREVSIREPACAH